MDNLLFIDIETFYDSKAGYDLRKLSTPEYVRDERFKLHGFGFCTDSSPEWITQQNCQETLSNIPFEDLVVLGWNLKFDGFILSEKYGIKPLEWRDVKNMAKAVLGRKVEDYSLRTVAAYFGLVPKGVMKVDGVRDLTPEQDKELGEYCIHDVELTRQIYEKLAPEFPENQYPLMDQTIRMFVEPKLELNVSLLEETAKQEKEQKIKIFSDIGIDKKVFSSNVKFPELLRSKGYEVPTKRSPSTGKEIPALALGDPEFLDLLESEDEELRRLCEARKEAKSTLLETRSEKLARLAHTGRWPFDVEFSGAVQTHRYSGGGSAGGNPQNFTRDSALREAVTAPKGFSLVVGDLSQADARFVAWISKDPGLLEAFKTGDPYTKFASPFFRVPINQVTKDQRKFGKTAILSLGYESGWRRFKMTVRKETGQRIDDQTAKDAVNLYRSMYCQVKAMWRRLLDFIPKLTDGSAGKVPFIPFLQFEKEALVLPSGLKLQYWNLRQDGVNRFGRPRWVYDDWGKKGQIIQEELYGGKIFGHICQACTGEVKKEVMRKFGSKVKGEIHDELILVSDNPIEDRADLEASMSISPPWLREITLQSEVGIGSNWAEAKKNV